MTSEASSGTLRSRDILHQGKVLFGAFMLSFVANAIFNMVMSRRLGVEDYGVLISLLAVFMVVSIPLQTLQTVLARAVAENAGNRKLRVLSSLHGNTWVYLAWTGAAVTAAGLLARVPLAKFLHLHASTWIFHLMLMILGATAGTVTKAFLQGFQKYDEMGYQIALDTLVRLFAAIMLVTLGVGVGGALFSQVLSSWLGTLVGLLFLAGILNPLIALKPKWHWHREARFAGPVALAFFLYAFLTITDVAFARHWFSAGEAGYYSAVATVGRIFQHGPFMLTAYMFPRAAFLHSRKENVRPLLSKTLTLTFWVVGLSLLLCAFFNERVIHLLFGGKFEPAVRLLPWYALAMAPMAFNWVLANALLAVGRYRFLYGMGLAVIVYAVGLTMFHRGPYDLIAVLAASGLTLLVWILVELRNELVKSIPVRP
jgi:O-antigen/teichoic acid export membrane protein